MKPVPGLYLAFYLNINAFKSDYIYGIIWFIMHFGGTYMLKKLILSFLLLVLFSITSQTTLFASDATTLVVNYYRFDDDYSQFDSIWLWNESDGNEGTRYFWESDGPLGKQLTIDLNEQEDLTGAAEIGVIVRDDDWAKDVDQDRFIDMTSPNEDGVVEVFLIQNESEIYYSEEEADITHQILFSTFEDDTVIKFNLTTLVESANITVTKDGETIPFSEFNMEDRRGTLKIENPVDLTKTYRLIIDFGDENPVDERIGFDDFYASDAFNDAYAYEGELGALYTPDETIFKLWAPISDGVTLNLYERGHTASQEDYDGNTGVDEPYKTIEMESLDQGVWTARVNDDLHGIYYTFSVDNGDTIYEVVDPYAFSTGVNGQRGMVVNFSETNPNGWDYGHRPDTIENYTDSIIYELHVRDLTSHDTWNGTEANRGKYLGLVEEGTTYQGYTTGFDHLKELGITHVHLLPVHDNGIIDETRLDDTDYHGIHDGIFNWGYMTRNFNTLEGSYSTDPYNGEVRVNEFKQMVQGFHNNDIRVVLDVVYNHTAFSADSKWHQIMPGYFHRMNEEGGFSNGSGTGNETASEREMFRKYMVDSIMFYVQEYNVDGFRFDLMELHDVETMQHIRDAVHEVDDSIIIYGEPWTGGETPLPHDDRATKANLDRMDRIAVFNDITRDAVKGSVFDANEGGFIQGTNNSNTNILFGVNGGLRHELLEGNIGDNNFTSSPEQTVNYVTAHDNNTLHDKLVLSTNVLSIEILQRMQRQANNITLTSQGMPFLHAGVEMMRTKPCVMPESGEITCDGNEQFDHNSYRSPDEVNQIDWSWKVDYNDTYEYYRSLIHLRNTKDVFRLNSAEAVEESVHLVDTEQEGLVVYAFVDEDDVWHTTLMVHNAGDESRDYVLPEGSWNLVATTDEIGDRTEEGLSVLEEKPGDQTITLNENDSLILYSTDPVEAFGGEPSSSPIIIVMVIIGAIIFGTSGFVIYKRIV